MVGKLLKTIASSFIIFLFIILVLTGIYTVKTGEEAVILRFGQYVDTINEAGLKWHLPVVDTVLNANLNEAKRLEFGFTTSRQGNSTTNPAYTSDIDESLMLTGDENLVSVQTIIQYKIKSAKDYYFNVDDQIGTLSVIAQSTIRRVVASHLLDEVLTDNKFGIQQEIKDDLQNTCEKYGLGIAITAIQLQDVDPPVEVDAAFKDVASAREDKTSYINEANSYKNEIIPNARGNAAAMINQSLAYKEERIEQAKGDVANFTQVLEKYNGGKKVTRTRMYLETLEEILPGIEKYIVDEDGNTVNLLPLSESSAIPATN